MTTELYLCRTKHGDRRHLTPKYGGVTLCGRLVHDIERNTTTWEPIKFADHWRSSALIGEGDDLCVNCEDKT